MTKTRQWTIFTAIAVIVVLLAGWFLLIKPQSTKASNLRSQAATQQQSNQVLVTQIAALQAEQRQLPQQQQALQKFSTEVPNDASEPAIIRQLSAAAAGSGVNLVSMTPGVASVVAPAGAVPGASTLPAAGAGTLVQLPIALSILGSYANVESFFQSLEKLPRALLVTGWSLCPTGGTSSSSGSVSCAAPAAPANVTLAPNTVGGTLNAVVFYAPPAGTTGTTVPGSTTAPATTTTTAPSTTTTPAPTTSTAATPTPTVASSAPAN
jgi:Tfp pilus assembly protein PilO